MKDPVWGGIYLTFLPLQSSCGKHVQMYCLVWVLLTYLMNLQLEAFSTKIPLNFILCPTSGLLLGSHISDK